MELDVPFGIALAASRICKKNIIWHLRGCSLGGGHVSLRLASRNVRPRGVQAVKFKGYVNGLLK